MNQPGWTTFSVAPHATEDSRQLESIVSAWELSFVPLQGTNRGSANPPFHESTCDSDFDETSDLTRGRYLHDSFN